MTLFRKPATWVAIVALLLGLALLGHRGIWDPDEGRYTNVALNMLDSGDWLNPQRADGIGHWTKPPATYWAIASSVAVFGTNPWAARLPAALGYLACVWLAWRMARRLSPGSETAASLAYATMLLPIGAAQWITTDFVLTAFSTFAVHGFVMARFDGAQPGTDRRRAWMATVWIGFALAFLTKGPPTLLPLLGLIAFDLALPGKQRPRVFGWSALLFLVVALPWYLAVVQLHPGLLQYFVGDEVVNRVATNEFGRHGQWYGWMAIYVPTLLFGTLPWTPALLRWARHLPGDLRRWWRDPAQRTADAPWLFLLLWIVAPLVVFCLARSRMPLYLLPLFAPLAILVAMQRQREGRPLPRWPWIAAWVALVLVLQLGAGVWRTHKDASEWAEELRRRAGGAPVPEVVFVEDMTRYGLHLHLGLDTRIEKIALDPVPQSPFDRVYDGLVEDALSHARPGAIWVSKTGTWPRVQARLRAQGYEGVPMGAPYQGRVLFRVVRR